MSFFSLVWSMLPWYVWLGVVLALVLVTALGIWPLVIGFLRLIPWWVYAAIAVIAGAWFAIDSYGDWRYAAGVADEHARAAKAQERADALANAELADEKVKNAALRKQAEEKLEQQKKDSAVDLANLKGSLPSYVSPLRLASFPPLPRGFLRYGTIAATWANGEGPRPGRSAVQPDDEPSAVSLPAWGEYVADQADAFRACTAWGSGWRDYAGRLKTQCEANISTLLGSQP